MTKQKYATKKKSTKSHANLWVAIIFIILAGIFLLALVNSDERRILHVESLFATQYNFSENESLTAPTSNPNELHSFADCVASISDIDIDIDIRFTGYSTPERWCKSKIVYYCHTIQIPDGQNCKTEEVLSNSSTVTINIFGNHDYLIWWLNQSTNNINSVTCSFTVNNNSFDFPTMNCYKTLKINLTTCTPTYKNITTFCATPKQIAQVKEVIR